VLSGPLPSRRSQAGVAFLPFLVDSGSPRSSIPSRLRPDVRSGARGGARGGGTIIHLRCSAVVVLPACHARWGSPASMTRAIRAIRVREEPTARASAWQCAGRPSVHLSRSAVTQAAASVRHPVGHASSLPACRNGQRPGLCGHGGASPRSVAKTINGHGGENVERLDLVRVARRQSVVVGVFLGAEAKHPVCWIRNT
jgi:hypothetical protein